MNGYQGKLARVDLTKGTVTVEALNRENARQFIGGRGLGTKMAYDELDPMLDPLGPDNKLYFMTGPFTGTPTPTGGRYMVITKAPLTGTIGSSNSGGYWGAELKFAGWDGISVSVATDIAGSLSAFFSAIAPDRNSQPDTPTAQMQSASTM